MSPVPFLLSVSSKGELAVIIGAKLLEHRLFTGTLARMTLESAARPWMEQVREADWSPDGATLAIIRVTAGRITSSSRSVTCCPS